jgi:hypothetical protein
MNVTELATDRIINGILKGHEGARSPQDVAARLAKNVVIRCASGRCVADDLWPAVWALSSVLERQLTGTIYIDAGIDAALPSPVSLGPRCVCGPCVDPAALSIELGSRRDAVAIAGDARCNTVSLDPLATGEKPTPIECFILAGYLGFQVLATLAEIPADRAGFAQRFLSVEYDVKAMETKLRQPEGFTFVGIGQVGQAFLALLWFWLDGDFGGRPLVLIDDDRFIDKNGRTQILLVQGGDWLGEEKAEYVSRLVKGWNASAKPLPGKIDFAWRRGSNPALAFLGTHDFGSRRMACVAGFDEIIECGVGTDMMAPRISWVSARGGAGMKAAKLLFKDRNAATPAVIASAEWVEELKSQPGACGWVQFHGASATAPCLGITAAGYALAESACAGTIRQGVARMWAQFLEPLRSSEPSS